MFLDNIKQKIMIDKKWQFFIACLTFLLITILASYKMFPSAGIITYGDAAYYHNIDSQWRNIITTLSTNYLGQNQSNSLWNYPPQAFITFLFEAFGLSDEIISYLLLFGTFFLTAMVYYIVFYRMSENFFFGILAGLFVILNNLTIEHIAFGGFLQYFFSLISFALLFDIFWRINVNKADFSKTSIILIILFSLLSFHPFYFIIYLSIVFLFLLFYIWRYHKFYNLWKLPIFFLGMLSAGSYWILPFFYSLLSVQPSDVYGAINLNNVFLGFLKIASYINAIDFFQYYNFFSRNFHQAIFHYIFYVGIIFLLLLSSLYIKKSRDKYFLLFLLILYLLFFNSALGPVSKIFGPTWTWMWNNISFFAFFRSFSRFLIVIIPIYLSYFAIYNLDWKYKHKDRIYVALIIVIICLNLKVLTGDLNGNVLVTRIPEEYEKINHYIDADKIDNNIISFPNVPYEAYEWGLNKDTVIIQQNYFLKDFLFDKPIIYERASLNLRSRNRTFSNVFLYNNFNNLPASLEKLNIGYVLVQKDLVNILDLKNKISKENLPNIEYKKYENYFNNNSSYTLLEKNNYFDLYKNNIKTKKILTSEASFKGVSSVKYRIYFKNLKKKQPLVFLQNYNSNWSLFITKSDVNNSCKIIDAYSDKDMETLECEPDQKFFEGEELSYLYKKPIFNDTHQLINDYANAWTIDPEYIKQNFSKDYYKENPDGSIDVELILYFKPQSYFYLGLMVSAVTLFGCFAYLSYDFVKKRKKKKQI